MVHLHLARFIGLQIAFEVRFAGVGVNRSPATAGHDEVHPMYAAGVGVVLNPVFKQMFMSGKNRPHMGRPKKRHVPVPQPDSLPFHFRPTMWPRRERCLMTEHDDVDVPLVIEASSWLLTHWNCFSSPT